MNFEELLNETQKVVRKGGENPFPEVRLLKSSLKINSAALDLLGNPEKVYVGFSSDNVYLAVHDSGNKVKDGILSCGGIKNTKLRELGETFSVEETDNENIFKLNPNV